MINVQKMMQQAQQVQFRLQELQEKFKEILVAGEAGGGLVKVTMTCDSKMKSIKIDPSLLGPGNQEMVEDLIIAAQNNAIDAKESKIREETGKMMEELGLPKDGTMPF
jgi:DNA-binding YbaB/EbfC family protein